MERHGQHEEVLLWGQDGHKESQCLGVWSGKKFGVEEAAHKANDDATTKSKIEADAA